MIIPSKAVIPAAGLGQRLRPITSVVPKEMFPIGNRPAIEWVIREAVSSGFSEIAVVIGPHKTIIEDYLTLYDDHWRNSCRLTILSQASPRGLAHALLTAREFCAEQPFAVLLPDDIFIGPTEALRQMVKSLKTLDGEAFALSGVSADHSTWGTQWRLESVGGSIYRMQCVQQAAGSTMESLPLRGVGRYLLTPKFLEYTAALNEKECGNELSDSVVFDRMIQMGERVYGVHVEGDAFDVSTAEGYVSAWQQHVRGQLV